LTSHNLKCLIRSEENIEQTRSRGVRGYQIKSDRYKKRKENSSTLIDLI